MSDDAPEINKAPADRAAAPQDGTRETAWNQAEPGLWLGVRKRWPIFALVIAIIGWFGFGRSQTVVESPEATLMVVDEAGKALPDAHIQHRWLSEPHGRLHRQIDVQADANGVVSLDKKMGSERIHPLCMHGVGFHYHGLCVSAPGFKDLWVQLEPVDGKLALTLPLSAGESMGMCKQSFIDFSFSEPHKALMREPAVHSAVNFTPRDEPNPSAP